MKNRGINDLYNRFYVDLNFERRGLFELLKNKLIAIYAGGITKSCKKYIKPGGIIVTNNHHNDAVEIRKDRSFVLDALIQKKGKKYSIVESENERLAKILKGNNKISKNMKNTNKGMKYVDTEQYFIFRRIC